MLVKSENTIISLDIDSFEKFCCITQFYFLYIYFQVKVNFMPFYTHQKSEHNQSYAFTTSQYWMFNPPD